MLILNESNYHSIEANQQYCSNSQYKDFAGTMVESGCEAKAMAKITGVWREEPSTAMLVGSYVDAHFSGTLDVFKAQNPDIFKRDGTLKAAYEHANTMIARYERDEYFMRTMSGGTQEIFTGELFGLRWKCKIDAYHKDKAAVDFKTCKSIREMYYTKEAGRVNFIVKWGYDIQSALYQKIVEVNTGKKLPFLIAAVSKEPEPDIEVIGFDQEYLDGVIDTMEYHCKRIIEVKHNGAEPTRCWRCEYCKHTKVLSGPVHFAEIGA